MPAYLPPPSHHEPTRRIPTKQLSHKGKLAAQLIALGYLQPEVAKMTHLSEAHLAVMVRSHLFQIEVERAQQKYISAHKDEIIERLRLEVPRSLDTVVEIRDSEARPADRLKAAEMIIDRVVPRKIESEERREVKITISTEAAEKLGAVLTEFRRLEPDETVIREFEELEADAHRELSS